MSLCTDASVMICRNKTPSTTYKIVKVDVGLMERVEQCGRAVVVFSAVSFTESTETCRIFTLPEDQKHTRDN